MEDCTICFTLPTVVKVMDCQHQVCHDCFIRLDKPQCPFCRIEFAYTQCELEERIKLNLDYNKCQPPNIINNSNTNTRITLPRMRNTIPNPNRPNSNRPNNITDMPFARLERQRKRKRRRNLTMDEVMERRRLIRKRCKLKWTKKTKRLKKTKWWKN